jgi:hypothetical protein
MSTTAMPSRGKKGSGLAHKQVKDQNKPVNKSGKAWDQRAKEWWLCKVNKQDNDEKDSS